MLVKKIPGLGSIVKIQRCGADISLDEVDRIAKKSRALFVAVEPDIKTEDPHYAQLEAAFKSSGYKDWDFFLCPTKTSYIDLTRNEDDILASFDQDVRKNLKNNQLTNITFVPVSNIEDFYSLLCDAGHRRHFNVQTFSDWVDRWKPFGDRVQVILAYQENKLLGGNMFVINVPTACGLFLPITALGKHDHIAAPLIWEGLKLAKSSGCTVFDLDGLYDERYKAPKKWLGLSEFKKKFRGHEVEFMHTKVKLYAWYLKPLEWVGLM